MGGGGFRGGAPVEAAIEAAAGDADLFEKER